MTGEWTWWALSHCIASEGLTIVGVAGEDARVYDSTLAMLAETLRRWVIQARIDRGLVVGPTTEELAEIKALRKEVADQQRTIEILKAATTFFARENDPSQR